MFKSNRPINPDKDFFGFVFRTRIRYYDEKILNEEFDPAKNIYRIPDNPKVVVDIGAHIGGTAIRAASMGAIVFAYEAERYNFEVLQYNVKINGLEDRIHYFWGGVGKPGKTILYVHPKASGTTSSYFKQRGLNQSLYQVVDFIAIKDVFKNCNIEHCDLLKLDCEGSEKDIIWDFTDELAARIKQVSVEFHDKGEVRELVRILSKWYVPENTHRYEWVFKKRV